MSLSFIFQLAVYKVLVLTMFNYVLTIFGRSCQHMTPYNATHVLALSGLQQKYFRRPDKRPSTPTNFTINSVAKSAALKGGRRRGLRHPSRMMNVQGPEGMITWPAGTQRPNSHPIPLWNEPYLRVFLINSWLCDRRKSWHRCLSIVQVKGVKRSQLELRATF